MTDRRRSTGHFDEQADVVVAGLGTTGALAAIAAARQGARVIGLECGHAMGGVATRGFIPSYFHGARGGLYEELDRDAARLAAGFTGPATVGWNPAAKAMALEQAALRAGVDIRYGARVAGVLRAGARVTGVQVVTEAGLRTIGARVTIDSTSEVLVARLAGCRVRLGREADGMPQPFSVPRLCLNAKGELGAVNFDAGLADGTDAESFSLALARALALPPSDKPFEELPRLIQLAPLPGLREGPLIEGEAVLCFSEMREERPAADALFRIRCCYDTHHKDLALESEAVQDWITVCALWYRELVVWVPYGAMVPKALDGLLVASRGASMDHDGEQLFRMQRDLQKLGEAAGTAAALAARAGCGVRAVDQAALHRELAATGCRVDEPEPEGWLTEPDAIRAGLESGYPGPAMWSARRLGREFVPVLTGWLAVGGEPLRRHAALALGLMRERAALPVLREMAAARDAVEVQGPRRKPCSTNRRDHAAIYLLGVLGDGESVPLLGEIAADLASGFQGITQACLALCRIARADAGRRADIRARLARIMNAPEFRLVMPLQTAGRGFAAPGALDRTAVYRRVIGDWLGQGN